MIGSVLQSNAELLSEKATIISIAPHTGNGDVVGKNTQRCPNTGRHNVSAEIRFNTFLGSIR